MKNPLLLLAFLFTCFISNAQNDVPQDSVPPKQGWTKGGTFTFLLNQSAYSNWIAGGENNFAGNLGINYDFNYLKDDISWDNKVIIAYGRTKIKGEESRKTDDRLEINSLFGKQAKGYWYYSFFVNFKTQMDVGNYIDEDGNIDESIVYSHFFSPAYLQAGPGMLWKKNENLKVNIAPATSKFIFVHSEFTDANNPENQLDSDRQYFGVDANKTLRYELGAAINTYYKFKVMDNVTIENILNLYSNYLEDPQNVDVDYTMNLVMKINKYLTTNLAFQAIYDDNAYRGFQIREVFGLGVNFGF
ncbi:DUF3078 domain-containing protein [Mangrovimonas aestuarii]|uniref:DUF3078 domain-containing protein n=1 Tax=Mangrovimonas aestuarii TaxID=3018443 RepID=UPI00237A0721|nr:DUF3078 domain-containing protein [Mangrovimonas aestuarii]